MICMVDKFKLAKKKSVKRAEYGRASEEQTSKMQTKEAIAEAVHKKRAKRSLFNVEISEWEPKTILGKKVKESEIKSLDEIFDKNLKILEPEIVDFFIPELKEKLMDTTKTSYVRMSGRKYNYRCVVLIGDGIKFIGLGLGKDKDKWVAATKAARDARLNLLRIKKGCGSWECLCGAEHTVPFEVQGKTGAARITLMPAPLGVGLVISESLKPILEFVGIKDVWSRTEGETGTMINSIKATIEALSETNAKLKVR